jgi:hypothetical protein
MATYGEMRTQEQFLFFELFCRLYLVTLVRIRENAGAIFIGCLNVFYVVLPLIYTVYLSLEGFRPVL